MTILLLRKSILKHTVSKRASNTLRNSYSRNVLASVDSFKKGFIDFYASSVKPIILDGHKFISCMTIKVVYVHWN